MPSKSVPPPNEALKVRRTKVKEGDTITVKVRVTRVDSENDRLTIQVPGALAPITAASSFFLDDDA
ncbi:MAG: hypothetical protein J0I48_08415 [Devosia sp.]|uniref:hypothetical protein n=1 Tax=Devosia sp. 66-22 TaxID=1895753 RepID=UPI0009294077|nr:hypothetical protein [Devosia sp. 66-22]MBN9346210.1 hypothetical protein [Devosia sp.]OJX49072.1 MAG: hypothetical protein BGO81_10830 [Devosia sp. 66-22]